MHDKIDMPFMWRGVSKGTDDPQPSPGGAHAKVYRAGVGWMKDTIWKMLSPLSIISDSRPVGQKLKLEIEAMLNWYRSKIPGVFT